MERTNDEGDSKKLGLFLLVMLIVGSIIGSGIFNSPTDLINKANPLATIIAWLVGGFGVLMLVLMFQMLSTKKPELKGGIYSYAKAGFGDYVGFNSAWGYWLSAFLGNVAFITMVFKTLNSMLGDKHQLSSFATFLLGSILLWVYHLIITRGIKQATMLNAVITIAKFVPLILVIVFGIAVFSSGTFTVQNWMSNLASTGESTSLGAQINNAMGTILWCFIGVEAAVVMSSRAKSSKLVGKSTVISFLIVLVLYMLISIISMGVVPAKQLAGSATPLADVLSKTFLGSAGSVIVHLGILISILGALVSWLMLTAEVPYIASKDGVMPKWFSKENHAGVPINSLIFSNGITQLFLLFLLIPQLQTAYSAAYTLATTAILVPYLFSALYALKITITEKLNAGCLAISVLATLYSVYVIYAVGLKYLAAAVILYAIGGIPFYFARREKSQSLTRNERIALGIIVMIALAMIVMIATGVIQL